MRSLQSSVLAIRLIHLLASREDSTHLRTLGPQNILNVLTEFSNQQEHDRDFCGVKVDLSPNHGHQIASSVDVCLIDDAHTMRDEVALLEALHEQAPLISRER